MSDRVARGWRAALTAGLLAAAVLAGPGAARADCTPLSANFVLCAEGTPWAAAEWHQFGDGASLELDGFFLEFTEHWATRDDGTALDAALDSLLDEMAAQDDEDGVAAAEMLLRDRFDSGALRVVRMVHNIDPEDDEPLLMAVMLAEGAGARIALFLGHADEIDLETLDREARALVALIHPARER